MVRQAQKEGQAKASSPEVARVASSIKKKDAKKFASTKHKGLPEKKKMNELTIPKVTGLGGGGGGTDSITDKSPAKSFGKRIGDVAKVATIPARFMLNIKSKKDPTASFAAPTTAAGKVDSAIANYKNLTMGEESCGKGMYYCRDEQKCKPIPKGTKVRKDGMLVKESIKDELLSKAEQKRKTYKQFRKDARTAGQKPLRRGEVRKMDRKTGKWVSNKD